MQEITLADSFGKALAKYSQGLELGLEIGGGTGDGSTQCIFTKTLYSIENDPSKIPQHQKNMDSRQGGFAVHGNSTEPERWMSEQEIVVFYKTIPTNLNKYSLDEIFGWVKQSIPYIGKYSGSAIRKIGEELGARFDFVLVDGHEFSGEADLKESIRFANKDCIVALDDVNAAKNHTNYQNLKKNSEILAEDFSCRNGWAIFKVYDPCLIQ
jgi:predicted O-methyltransferase YrrM